MRQAGLILLICMLCAIDSNADDLGYRVLSNDRGGSAVAGEMLVEIIERERRATALEIRSGVSPRPSILTGIADVAWHVGWEGVLESVATIKVHGSRLDDASAVLAGKPAPEAPNPTAAEIAAARGNPSTWRG